MSKSKSRGVQDEDVGVFVIAVFLQASRCTRGEVVAYKHPFFNQKRAYLAEKSKKNKKIFTPLPASTYVNFLTPKSPIFRTKLAPPSNYREASFFKEARKEGNSKC